MTNNITVVGKVINGRMITIVASGNRIIGQVKPVHHNKVIPNIVPIPQAPVEQLDVPTFMKERTIKKELIHLLQSFTN